MSGSNPASRQNRMRTRYPVNVDENVIAEKLESMERAIQDILRKNLSGISYEEMYRNAYMLVLHRHGEKLYNGMKKTVSDYLTDVVAPKIVTAMEQNHLPAVFSMTWDDYSTSMIMIRDMLNYMDRVYVAQNTVENIDTLGFRLFKELVIEKDGVVEYLKKTFLKMIADERNGTNSSLWTGMKRACEILVTYNFEPNNMYVKEFEEPFLKRLTEFYTREGYSFLELKNVSAYVIEVERCLEIETNKAKRYPDTKAKALEVLHRVLITDHLETIVNWENSGLEYMLANDMIEDLKRMYNLLRGVNNGLAPMVAPISRHLRSLGDAVVELLTARRDCGELLTARRDCGELLTARRDCLSSVCGRTVDRQFTARQLRKSRRGELLVRPASCVLIDHVKYIQLFLELKDQYDCFVTDVFANEKLFKDTIQKVFEEVFNENSKCSEYLALYVDDKLKKGGSIRGDVEIESHLGKAMTLFCFLQEKDIFEHFYKQHLAKRLLLDKSISDDLEKTILSKLKAECGCQFTRNLENMFRDKELWDTVANDFRDYKTSNNLIQTERDPDISVRVLTAGVWPTPTSSFQCILPAACVTSFKTFEEFYTRKHSGRKITLNTLLGTADIRAVFYGGSSGEEAIGSTVSQFPKREIILQTNTHIMVVLMRFNAKPKMTFEEITADTQIPEKELKSILHALAMGETAQRILGRKWNGKEIEGTDEFYVNDSFTSKLVRLKIQLITTKNYTEPDRKEIQNRVEEDRRQEVEAAIVRIMKSQKQLLHNVLITEVTQQLGQRFMPSPILIEKRIESLIEREYLSRDSTDHKLYNYVA